MNINPLRLVLSGGPKRADVPPPPPHLKTEKKQLPKNIEFRTVDLVYKLNDSENL
jgi:hypothetical protein